MRPHLFIVASCLCVAQVGHAEPPALDLSGTWAQWQRQTSIAKVPLVGEVETRTISRLLVRITQRGDRLQVESVPCSIQIESDIDLVRTIVPEPMLRALGTQTFRARLRATHDSWTYYQPPSMQTLGVTLKDAWKDAMPTDARDPRLVDADGDGHPGVTVRIEGAVDGEVYVAQRSWSRLEGQATPNSIRGALTWQTDQAVLGASSALLSNSPRATPSTKPNANTFAAVRVADATTCSEIVGLSAAAFSK